MADSWDSWDEKLLKRTADLPPPNPHKGGGVAWVSAVFLTATVIATYVAFYDRPTRVDPTTSRASASQPVAQPGPALGGDSQAFIAPPLDESDVLVRELVRRLSSHPRVVGWLAGDDLIRSFVVVVTSIADGDAPAARLQSLRPSMGFRVVERGSYLYLDARSYARYAGVSRAVASIDPFRAASLYAMLKSRIDEAHSELGLESSFDRTLERAIVLLLSTPVPQAPVRVEPRGIGYRFADPDLENLTAAQKRLVRMGPANAQVVQRALRNIAVALGIPSQRLPVSGRPNLRWPSPRVIDRNSITTHVQRELHRGFVSTS